MPWSYVGSKCSSVDVSIIVRTSKCTILRLNRWTRSSLYISFTIDLGSGMLLKLVIYDTPMDLIRSIMCCRREESTAFACVYECLWADQQVPSPHRQRDLPVASPGTVDDNSASYITNIKREIKTAAHDPLAPLALGHQHGKHARRPQQNRRSLQELQRLSHSSGPPETAS
jgi:hypothetical protein